MLCNRLHKFENVLSQVVTLEIWNSTFKNIGNRLHAHGNRLLLCKTIITLFRALLFYGNRLLESKKSSKIFFFEKFFWTNCAIQSFLWKKIFLYLSWYFSWSSCISWVFSWILILDLSLWNHQNKLGSFSSTKTWEEIVEKFLKKYFPKSKTAKGKATISSFHQFPDESLSEALERFRSLLRKTPTHGFSKPIQLNIFIDGLRLQSKQLLDASSWGKIKLKTPEEERELIENMATSDHAILRDRTHVPTKRSLLEISSQDALLALNKLLAKQLESLTETLSKLPTQLQVVC